MNNPNKRTNKLLGAGIAILFIMLGFYLLLDVANKPTQSNSFFIRFLGLANIIFFSVLLIWQRKKVEH